MAVTYSLGQEGVKIKIKVTDCLTNTDFDITEITDQKIVFVKPDGSTFEKQATLDSDPANPPQVIALSNIVGDGIEDTITVTIPNTALLKDGELMSISATTNFNATNKAITITSATTFTYQLGFIGSTTPESTGTVTTQGEKLITYHNTSPEASIFDLRWEWEYTAVLTLSTGDVAQLSQRRVAWVL